MSGSRSVERDGSALIRRARALDDDALTTLYGRYLSPVYRFVLARVGNPHLAEDVTAETFVSMVESIERLRGEDELTFAAWLFGIARNRISDHYRRAHGQPEMTSELASHEEPLALAEAGDPLRVVLAREEWGDVVAGLRGLTEEQRDVLLYRCLLGYSTEEVASMLGRQAGAIRALQFRALSALARQLARLGSNPRLKAIREGRDDRPAPGRRSRRSDDAARR
ncbi:MAG TPA: sigma-70 family RNA polymerase sigma factor [Ktedonobacterales bacterium]